MTESYEDPGVDINDEIPRMSEEVIEELRARGIEMPDWHLKIPTPGDDQIERLSSEEIERRKKLFYNQWPYTDEPCPYCGCPAKDFDGHVCEDYDRWWVKRNDQWTQVEVGELPNEGETIYILHYDEDPEEIL